MKVSKDQIEQIKRIVEEEIDPTFFHKPADILVSPEGELEEVGVDWLDGSAYGAVGYVSFDEDGEYESVEDEGKPYAWGEPKWILGNEVVVSSTLNTFTRIRDRVANLLSK